MLVRYNTNREGEHEMKSPVLSQITLYVIIGVLALALITVGAVVAITNIRPGEENLAIIGAIITFIGTAIGSLLAFVLKLVSALREEVKEARLEVQETHHIVNSRMDQLLVARTSEAKEVGKAAGVEQERDRDKANN